MENTVKKTKAMYFAELREMVMDWTDAEDQDELLEFIDKEIETLGRRKEAAAVRAEKKRAESDAMTEDIFAQIGDELITVDAIMENLTCEDVTRNKVASRLGKLVKMGRIEKEAVKVDGKSRMAYRLAAAE